MPTLRTRTPSLSGCGIPAFTFAGFSWPRYLATLPSGSLSDRLRDRTACYGCGDYYHAPTPNNRDGRGFYLGRGDRALGLRFTYADEVNGAGINHDGWFCDEDGWGDTIRGIVLRLPHGRGFLAGWTMGEEMASSVDYSPIFHEESDAARYADSLAKDAAERFREEEEEDTHA